MSAIRIDIDRLTISLGNASLEMTEALSDQLQSAIGTHLAKADLKPGLLMSTDLREIQLAPIQGPLDDVAMLADAIAERLVQQIVGTTERGM